MIQQQSFTVPLSPNLVYAHSHQILHGIVDLCHQCTTVPNDSRCRLPSDIHAHLLNELVQLVGMSSSSGSHW